MPLMMRFAGVLIAAFAVTLAAAQDIQGERSPDLTGIWHSEAEDLVVRRTGSASWLGYPTEGRGEAAGISWHFQHLGEDAFQFWILLRGKATTQKLVDERIRIEGSRDEISLSIPDRKGKRSKVSFRRVFVKIPDRLGGLIVTFVPQKRDKLKPDQDVDVRLVRALERAAEAAREADPDLKRINVCATIDRNLGHSKRHSRFIRGAITIDTVNGARAEHWREDVSAKLRSIEEGEAPDVNRRLDYGKHVAALLLGLLLEEEIDEVVCPAVLDEKNLPYLEWWIKRYGTELPRRAPSILGWRKKWSAMLDGTKETRKKVKDGLHVAVRPLEKPVCRHKRSKEKKYDRK
ncbi:MAG: hypothetical protein ACYS99_16870 [Planctomycetota bacterium]|jgi:hypothetical protein